MDKYLQPNSAYERFWAEYNKFYKRFQHLVIKQDTSKVIIKIEL